MPGPGWLDGAHDEVAVHTASRNLISKLEERVLEAAANTLEIASEYEVETVRRIIGEDLMGQRFGAFSARPYLLHPPHLSVPASAALAAQILGNITKSAWARKTDWAPDDFAATDSSAEQLKDLLEAKYSDALQEEGATKGATSSSTADSIGSALVALAHGDGFAFLRSAADGVGVGGSRHSLSASFYGLLCGRPAPAVLRRHLWNEALLGEPTSATEVIRNMARLSAATGGSSSGGNDGGTPGIAGLVSAAVSQRLSEALPRLLGNLSTGSKDAAGVAGGNNVAGSGSSSLLHARRVSVAVETLLNNHYRMTGRFENRHVSFAVPFILAYQNGEKDGRRSDEGIPQLVMLAGFDSLCRCFGQAGVKTAAAGAHAEIARRDPELGKHVQAVISAETARGAADGSDKGAAAARRADIVTEWVEHALVGFLSEDPLLLLWDHMLVWAPLAGRTSGSDAGTGADSGDDEMGTLTAAAVATAARLTQLSLAVADVAVLVRGALLSVNAGAAMRSLAKAATRRLTTKQLRQALQTRLPGRRGE